MQAAEVCRAIYRHPVQPAVKRRIEVAAGGAGRHRRTHDDEHRDGGEADGVVVRTVPAQVPPRVDYALNHLGQELMPVLESPHAFGEQVGQDG